MGSVNSECMLSLTSPINRRKMAHFSSCRSSWYQMRPGPTVYSSLETISPLMHMTGVSGTASNKGCIMNSQAQWTAHDESALQSCQARCFNGLISEAIIVNTSQWRRLEQREEALSGCLFWVLIYKASYEHSVYMSLETKTYRVHNSKWAHVTDRLIKKRKFKSTGQKRWCCVHYLCRCPKQVSCFTHIWLEHRRRSKSFA